MKIGLIACSKTKLGKDNPEQKFKAKDIYQGNTFKIAKNSGIQKYNCDDYSILSAKYGLLYKDKEISYYDSYLGNKSASFKKAWAEIVLEQLKALYDLEKDVFYIFGGKEYYENLIQHLHCFVFSYKNSNTINLDDVTEYCYGVKQNG